MTSIKKRTYPKIFSVIAVIYAVLFFIYYVINHLAYDSLSEKEALCNVLENVRYFLYDGVEFLVPTVIAPLTLLHFKEGKRLRGILLAFVLSLGKSTYNFFYFYLYHTALGYEWLGAILGSLAVTLGYAAALAAYSSAIAAVGYLVLRLGKVRKEELFDKSPVYDFSFPATKSIFAICLSNLAVEFVIEAVSIVEFFVKYGAGFMIGEIVFMSMCLAYLPLMLLISQLVSVRVKNAVVIAIKKEEKKKKRS